MGDQFAVLCKHLGIPLATESPESSIFQHQQLIIHLASSNLIRYPKIDFPRFNASIHFDGKADSWFLDYQEGKTFLDWDKFIHDVCLRFEDVAYDNYVGSFNKLSQTSTLEEYFERYESLKAVMKAKHKDLFEDYYTLSFISGLKEEIRNPVQMFKPSSDTDAFYLARMQQASVEFQSKCYRYQKPFIPSQTFSSSPSTSRPPVSPLTTIPASSFLPSKPFVTHPTTPTRAEPPTPPIRRLTPAQMKVKIDKGLYYNCDEMYEQGHMCKTQQLFMLVASAEESSLSVEETEEDAGSPTPFIESTMEISLHALTGLVAQNTIRVPGKLNNKDILVLVDTGSTHSFVDARIAEQLHLHIQPTGHMLVTVANGDTTTSSGLGDVMFNLSDLLLSFVHQGQNITLQGCATTPSCSMISGSSLLKFLKSKTPTLIGNFFSLTAIHVAPTPPVITLVLQDYQDVFAEPKTLPPARALDHHIPLNPNTTPSSQRPYRCPYVLKAVVEKLVQEMLESGIIQHSNSPFAATIFLVKKKDESWRFCVDYRKLNDSTITNKFPIPLIDDLLDELNGKKFFSRIDLKSVYHQIRMHLSDIFKTAFRTHHGHYEFRVMPFGLTNAPATFQALMNQIFQPFLRKFIIVFFDDILVYSDSLEEHILHLSQSLSLLRQHSLFANWHKYFFAQNQLAYLGHLVTSEGVAADPDKLAAMENWPQPTTVKQLRGFLRLTGYYRRFIKSYGTII
ncbi:uncharacterized protein LOC113316020 [Papaver somniferum]|uniref:uncharacterized protein LOC113316020 n=1 Tax=Papaver somniferum TaxID=3469 RepID=UPI000E6F8E4A|nr:uncharacterized protein LOC113316020 [Papaver somniferum]